MVTCSETHLDPDPGIQLAALAAQEDGTYFTSNGELITLEEGFSIRQGRIFYNGTDTGREYMKS